MTRYPCEDFNSLKKATNAIAEARLPLQSIQWKCQGRVSKTLIRCHRQWVSQSPFYTFTLDAFAQELFRLQSEPWGAWSQWFRRGQSMLEVSLAWFLWPHRWIHSVRLHIIYYHMICRIAWSQKYFEVLIARYAEYTASRGLFDVAPSLGIWMWHHLFPNASICFNSISPSLYIPDPWYASRSLAHHDALLLTFSVPFCRFCPFCIWSTRRLRFQISWFLERHHHQPIPYFPIPKAFRLCLMQIWYTRHPVTSFNPRSFLKADLEGA